MPKFSYIPTGLTAHFERGARSASGTFRARDVRRKSNARGVRASHRKEQFNLQRMVRLRRLERKKMALKALVKPLFTFT